MLMRGASNRQSTADFNETAAVTFNSKLWGHSAKPFKVDDEWYTPLRYIEAARKGVSCLSDDLSQIGERWPEFAECFQGQKAYSTAPTPC
jgi:hypothetical protein